MPLTHLGVPRRAEQAGLSEKANVTAAFGAMEAKEASCSVLKQRKLPSGKSPVLIGKPSINYGKSQFLIGKSSLKMVKHT